MKIEKGIFWVFILVAILFLFSAAKVNAAEQAMSWGGAITVGSDERTSSITTMINIYDESTGIGWWIQNVGTLPVLPNRLTAECSISALGFEHIEEVGLTPDMGLTKYKAEAIPGKGYVVKLDTSQLPLGARALNWYIVHRDSKGRLVIVILVFSWAKQGTAYGGCFCAIVEAPSDWASMPPEIKLTFCQGFMPMTAWSSNQEAVNKWRETQANFGSVLVKGKPGATVEFDCGDGQLRSQTIPEQGGFILQNLAKGATVSARYAGQPRFSGEATIVAGSTVTLQLHELGSLRILSNTKILALVELTIDGSTYTKGVEVNRESFFPAVYAGSKVRVQVGNNWFGPVEIVAGQTAIVDLDAKPADPMGAPAVVK